MYCNKCGKKIKTSGEMIQEGVFSVSYDWGYFSNKDGERHKFILCEDCYDELIKEFQLPVEILENTELI